MATPPDSPGPEEALFEFETARARHQNTRPVALEELLRQTKFSRQEIRVMYRGFKQVGKSDFVCNFSITGQRLNIAKIVIVLDITLIYVFNKPL